MGRKVSGAVVLLLLGLLLSSSEGARIKCLARPAKNPSCGTGNIMDGTCDRQCKSEGYIGWVCISSCSCIVCPSLEHRSETVELQNHRGNKGTWAAGVGAV